MLTTGLRATDRSRENSIQQHLISYFFRKKERPISKPLPSCSNQFHTVLSVVDKMDDIEAAHRGGRRKEGLLQPKPETPEMPLWQTVFRYILEILAILCLSTWASTRQSWFGAILAIFLVLSFLRIFNVKDDPATIDRPCVVVPGIIRIVLELAIHCLACFCLWDLLDNRFGLPTSVVFVYAGVIVLYYIASMERVKWVLRQ
jgi:hypothetical protein